MSTKSIVAANDILRAKHRVEIVPRGRGFVFHHMDSHILEQDKAVRQYANGKKTADLTVEELVQYGEQFASIKTGKEPVTPNIALANISLKKHGVEIRKTGRTFVYAHVDPEHEARHPAQNLRVYVGENASINSIQPVELVAHGVEFADALPDESPIQGGSTADLKYEIETSEVAAGWNDSGFRHRVVCSDGRVSRWAPYTAISFLDDCASVPPYFTDGNDNQLMNIREAFALVAYGEETQTVAQSQEGEEDYNETDAAEDAE